MKTILAFTHLTNDSQISAVRNKTKGDKIKFIEVSTNKLDRTQLSLLVKGSRIDILYKGKVISNPVLWFATNHRCDTVYALNSRFPNESRLNALQFVTDISFIPSTVLPSYPGTLSNILRSDSKPFLFSLASQIGLITPSITLNSTFKQRKSTCREIMYKKKLGHPSFISFDRDKRKEVIVEIKNDIESKSSEFNGLWQWQSVIESAGHIRCFAHKDLIKSKIWYRKSLGDSIIDLRQSHDSGRHIKWLPFKLPVSIDRKIKKLLSILDLDYACPEFLLDQDGNIVFIDLNPCGDWIGFFCEKTEKDLISGLISHTLSK